MSLSRSKKVKVYFFQRRPREGFNFSMEHIFNDVRQRLKDKLDFTIKISKFYNDGILSKLYNIVEAGLRQGGDVNHITGEVHFLALLMNRKRVLLTVLDCGFLQRKKGVSKTIVNLIYLKLPIKKAAYVTSISEMTKKEVILNTNCSEDKIKVIPVAIDPIYQPSPKEFNVDKPTILQVGLGPNKNVFRLIEALEGLRCHLSIIGMLTQNHIDKLNEHGVEYSHASGLSQQEMLEKYRQCDIVAFVSTFEGFGMPIVEANAVERVCITSNISSMPEIAADSACLVDPYNVNDITKGVKKLISDNEYRKKLLENGRQNKLRFDPDIIANEYFKLYELINGTKSTYA